MVFIHPCKSANHVPQLGCCKGSWPHSVPTGRGDKCSDWCHAMHLEGWLLYKTHSMLRTVPAMEILKSVWTDLDLRPFYYLDTPSNEPVACLSQLWWWVDHFFHPQKRIHGRLGDPFLEEHGQQNPLDETGWTWTYSIGAEEFTLTHWNAFIAELSWS